MAEKLPNSGSKRQCLLWVISRHQQAKPECPLSQRLRTFIQRRGRSLLLSDHSLFAANISLFCLVGNCTCNPSCSPASSVARRPDSDWFPCNFPEIREFDGRDAFAATSQHSHPVAGFLALSRPQPNCPEEARNCATKWRRFCLESG